MTIYIRSSINCSIDSNMKLDRTLQWPSVFDNTSTDKTVFLPLYGVVHVRCTKRITTPLDYDFKFVSYTEHFVY